MGVNDIGIDLGTASVMIYIHGKGIVLREPSVVAVNTKTGKALSFGQEAYDMLGKTPSTIQAIQPMRDGVISDYEITENMIKHYINKACGSRILKPRVAICVPSRVTEVESRAVMEAAVKVGARKVYLIDEPVAAAIGAGVDIMPAKGHMVVDIGGGTTDVAVLSMGGIVSSKSIRVAGSDFDESIIRNIRSEYKLLLGQRMAENTKINAGSVWDRDEHYTCDVKGRNLLNGLPSKIEVTRADLYDAMIDNALEIVDAVKEVLEMTPPELVGDIMENGIIMTGGGSLLSGLDKLIENSVGTRTYVAQNTKDCVAVGTGKSFDYIDKLGDGFKSASAHIFG